MPEHTLPVQILDTRPGIYEITNHARTAAWNNLGIQLKLNDVSLAGCNDCATVYQLWRQEKGNHATRRVLLAALRAIGQTAVADDYVDYLKKVSDIVKDNLHYFNQFMVIILCYMHAYKIY